MTMAHHVFGSEPVRVVPPGGWSCGKCSPSTKNMDTSICLECGLVLLGHHDEQHNEAHAVQPCASAVDHPAHYKAGGLEAIDVIEALGHGHGFCLGNAIKYLWRAGKKTPDALADLRKARWYVERAIAAMEKTGERT